MKNTHREALTRLDGQFTRTCILWAFSRGCTMVELAQLVNVSCVDIEMVIREALMRSKRGAR